MKIFSRFAQFVAEVKVEMLKVSWSSRDELVGSTVIVIISTLMLGIFIGIVDIILSKFVNILLR
jgi:preprotein translocase subunit SecE